MPSKSQISFTRTFTRWIQTAVPLITLVTTSVPVQAIIPGFSPFEAKYPDGSTHPSVSTCSVEQELQAFPMKGNPNWLVVPIKTLATADQRYGSEPTTIPAQSFTLNLKRSPKTNQVVVSTSQGLSVTLNSQAPLSAAKVWLMNLDGANKPQIPEVIVSIPERTPDANTAVPYSIVVLKDMQGGYDRDKDRPWRLYPLKTVSADPKQDFVRIDTFRNEGDCTLLTAESVTLPNKGAFWNYRITRFHKRMFDQVDYQLTWSPYPLFLPQAGTDTQKRTPLQGMWGDRMMGKYMGKAPQLTATVQSLQAGSRPGEAQVIVKDAKGKRMAIVPTEVLYVCTNFGNKDGSYLPNFLDTQRVEDLKSFLYEGNKQQVKIYGLRRLSDGHSTADLIMVEDSACAATPPWPS